jgi:hypothetical protein
MGRVTIETALVFSELMQPGEARFLVARRTIGRKTHSEWPMRSVTRRAIGGQFAVRCFGLVGVTIPAVPCLGLRRMRLVTARAL